MFFMSHDGHMITSSILQATLVDNLEVYGIDPDKFASDMQKMAATSASGHWPPHMHIMATAPCVCVCACVRACVCWLLWMQTC